MPFKTLTIHQEGAAMFVEIAAPPMNLLGPELVCDLVTLIQASSGKFVGDSEHQRGGSLRNRRNFRQVESNDLC